MELPPSPSSRHFSARKPGESGLAEWAQKIRALQRQVDADEEEEHRRLEQEIAASRLARVRRSAGYSRVSLDPVAGTPFLQKSGRIDRAMCVHSSPRHLFPHFSPSQCF